METHLSFLVIVDDIGFPQSLGKLSMLVMRIAKCLGNIKTSSLLLYEALLYFLLMRSYEFLWSG